MTLGIHCWCLSIILVYLMYPGYTLFMMTLGIHCWCLSIILVYLMYPGYTLLWWPWVYIAGAYLYHYYTLCTLDTHCYDDPGYTLLVLIYNTIIPYVPWIHIVMMTLGIHCWCLSIILVYLMYPGYTLLWWPLGIHCWCLSISLLYLMYPGYTLLWWPWVYMAGAYLQY